MIIFVKQTDPVLGKDSFRRFEGMTLEQVNASMAACNTAPFDIVDQATYDAGIAAIQAAHDKSGAI